MELLLVLGCSRLWLISVVYVYLLILFVVFVWGYDKLLLHRFKAFGLAVRDDGFVWLTRRCLDESVGIQRFSGRLDKVLSDLWLQHYAKDHSCFSKMLLFDYVESRIVSSQRSLSSESPGSRATFACRRFFVPAFVRLGSARWGGFRFSGFRPVLVSLGRWIPRAFDCSPKFISTLTGKHSLELARGGNCQRPFLTHMYNVNGRSYTVMCWHDGIVGPMNGFSISASDSG